jgi:hypothetical protein
MGRELPREREERIFANQLERERTRNNENILAQKHINILLYEITIMPLPLNVLNPTLILIT